MRSKFQAASELTSKAVALNGALAAIVEIHESIKKTAYGERILDP
jgi:hypothetical protein